MIVYAGKQFWNDFNNWDEALFQDAERPRDDDKFKLRPWMQSGKWDFRWTNKNTDFSHIMIKWYTVVPWTASGDHLQRRVPKLQEEWTSSELSPIAYTWATPEIMEIERENSAFVMVKSWNIKYLTWSGQSDIVETTNTSYFEIAQSWLYYIVMYWQFYFDSTYYDSSTSYQYKERVGIAQNIKWVFTKTNMTQARACGNWDTIQYTQISRCPAWTQMLPLLAHSFTDWTNYVTGSMLVVRLW